MRKTTEALLICLLAVSTAQATVWYAATSSANINAVTWYPTQGASCAGSGTALVWGNQLTGDTFDSNGCTAIAINVDPGSGTLQVTLTTDATNTGGGFTYATATNISIHANVIGAKNVALTISGSTGGGTIAGNATGGSAAGDWAISDSHTAVTLNLIGNFTGGTGAGAYILNGATGTAAITGNATSTAGGVGISAGGAITLTGNCIGYNATTGSSNAACNSSGSGSLTITGSLFNGTWGAAAAGSKVFFTPAATGCITYPSSSSGALQTSCPSAVVSNVTTLAPALASSLGSTANVASGVQYGGMTGTASSGGTSVSATGSW